MIVEGVAGIVLAVGAFAVFAGTTRAWAAVTGAHAIALAEVSRTLTEAAWANTKISSADLVSTVRELKADGEVPLRTMGVSVVASHVFRWEPRHR